MIQNYIIVIIIIMMRLKDYSIEIIISNRLFSVLQQCGKTVSIIIIINIRWYMFRMNVRTFAHSQNTQWKTQTKRIRLA